VLHVSFPWWLCPYIVLFMKYSKIPVDNCQSCLPPLSLAPLLGMTRLEFYKNFWRQKTRILVLSCCIDCLMIGSVVLTATLARDRIPTSVSPSLWLCCSMCLYKRNVSVVHMFSASLRRQMTPLKHVSCFTPHVFLLSAAHVNVFSCSNA